VLEARDRVGGRVHSYQGDFACPVDLGASIITGTEVRHFAALCVAHGDPFQKAKRHPYEALLCMSPHCRILTYGGADLRQIATEDQDGSPLTYMLMSCGRLISSWASGRIHQRSWRSSWACRCTP